MNPFSGLRNPTAAMRAGINYGCARGYLMAARTALTHGHPISARNYVSMARSRHHEYLRMLKQAREQV